MIQNYLNRLSGKSDNFSECCPNTPTGEFIKTEKFTAARNHAIRSMAEGSTIGDAINKAVERFGVNRSQLESSVQTFAIPQDEIKRSGSGSSITEDNVRARRFFTKELQAKNYNPSSEIVPTEYYLCTKHENENYHVHSGPFEDANCNGQNLKSPHACKVIGQTLIDSGITNFGIGSVLKAVGKAVGKGALHATKAVGGVVWDDVKDHLSRTASGQLLGAVSSKIKGHRDASKAKALDKLDKSAAITDLKEEEDELKDLEKNVDKEKIDQSTGKKIPHSPKDLQEIPKKKARLRKELDIVGIKRQIHNTTDELQLKTLRLKIERLQRDISRI